MRYRGIHQRRVRTASGSDWILRATQHKHLFRKLLLIRSLPLAVLTRLVATLTFSYTQWASAFGRQLDDAQAVYDNSKASRRIVTPDQCRFAGRTSQST